MFRTGGSVDITRLSSYLACIGALAFAASPSRSLESPADGKLSAMPLSFEVNHRQAPSGVRFLSRGRGYYLELRDTSFALGLNVPHGGLSRLEMTLAGARPARIEAGRVCRESSTTTSGRTPKSGSAAFRLTKAFGINARTKASMSCFTVTKASSSMTLLSRPRRIPRASGSSSPAPIRCHRERRPGRWGPRLASSGSTGRNCTRSSTDRNDWSLANTFLPLRMRWRCE